VSQRAEVLSKEKMKAARDNQSRTRGITIDRIAVSNPQSVKSHRVTSLKAISIFATKKPRTAGGPREKSLAQRDRLRERKDSTKIRPHLLCQRAGVNKVTKVLGSGTGVTKEAFRSETKDASAEG